MSTLLAADVGATKTLIGLFNVNNGIEEPQDVRTFKNDNFDNLGEILSAYQEETNREIRFASLGVAGPVRENQARLSNRSWDIEGEAIARDHGFREAILLNDLQATALAVLRLGESDLATLNSGQTQENAPKAVIAPGTGLGEAYLANFNGQYKAFASEGGHSDFAANTSLQAELKQFLQKKYGRVSYERICSGSGIPNIYEFLKVEKQIKEPDWLSNEIKQTGSLAPILVENALSSEKNCEICQETLEIFLEVLAAEAGNLALKVGALGGVYLGGGIPPKILPSLKRGTFIETFANKGRYQGYLEKIPVYLILSPIAALLGAALYGQRIFASHNKEEY